MRQNLIALADYRGMDSSQIIRHEYVHFVLRNATTIRYPTWYDEGFAEYMSSYAVRKNQELVIGTVQPERVQVLNWAPWIPLRRVIEARGLDSFHNRTEVAVSMRRRGRSSTTYSRGERGATTYPRRWTGISNSSRLDRVTKMRSKKLLG